MSTSEQRSLNARIASHISWAKTPDPAERTAPGRDKFLERFEREVDPDSILPRAERARRAEHLRKAYFARLALKSAQARRKKQAVDAKNAGPDSRRSSETASAVPDAVRAV